MYGNLPPPGAFPRQRNDIQYNATSGLHSYRPEEVTSFANFFNFVLGKDPELSNVLPLDPNNHDQFFQSLEDGVLLCKLLNVIQPNAINPQHIMQRQNMSVFQKSQNLNTAIKAAKDLGLQAVNIGAEDFLKGNRHIILALVWQIIRFHLLSHINLNEHPEMVKLLQTNESITEVLSEKGLLRWFNHHLANAGHPRRVNNFSSDIQDGENYLVLLSELAPNVVSKSTLAEKNPQTRATMVCDFANRLGVQPFVTPQDILNGNSNLNLAFTADLFNKLPGIQVNEYSETQLRVLKDAELELQKSWEEAERVRAQRWDEEDRARAEAWAYEDAERAKVKANWAQEDEERRKQQEEKDRMHEEQERMHEERMQQLEEEARKLRLQSEVQVQANGDNVIPGPPPQSANTSVIPGLAVVDSLSTSSVLPRQQGHGMMTTEAPMGQYTSSPVPQPEVLPVATNVGYPPTSEYSQSYGYSMSSPIPDTGNPVPGPPPLANGPVIPGPPPVMNPMNQGPMMNSTSIATQAIPGYGPPPMYGGYTTQTTYGACAPAYGNTMITTSVVQPPPPTITTTRTTTTVFGPPVFVPAFAHKKHKHKYKGYKY